MDVLIKLVMKFFLKFLIKDQLTGGAYSKLISFLLSLFGLEIGDVTGESTTVAAEESTTNIA